MLMLGVVYGEIVGMAELSWSRGLDRARVPNGDYVLRSYKLQTLY